MNICELILDTDTETSFEFGFYEHDWRWIIM